MRVGILGYGYMGTIRRRVLESRGDCVVTRIFHTGSLGEPALEAPSWEAVVDDPAVDAVVVCLPNDGIAPAVCRALRAGKPVFAEKPPGRSVPEAWRMARAAQETGQVLKFGFNHRYHPAYTDLVERARDLGELVWMRGRYGKPRDPDFAAGWRADRERAGGGILLDQGIHMLDLMRALAGGLDVVSAVAMGGPVEDEVMALLRGDGLVAQLHSSHGQDPPLFSLEVGMTGGNLVMDGLLSRSGRYGPERLRWWGAGGTGERVYDVDDSWERELDEWVRAIRGEGAVAVGSPAEAVDLMRLLASIYEAAGRPLGVH